MSIYILITYFFISSLTAQVNFTHSPSDLRVYARNRATDSAIVPVEGSVNKSGTDYTSIMVKVYRGASLFSTASQELTFSGNNANFTLAPKIKAELVDYRIEIYGVNSTAETKIKTANRVVAGDAFIIQGQSNAQAMQYDGDANVNKNPYIRVLGCGDENGCNLNWHEAQGNSFRDQDGNTGQWGLRLARLLLDNKQIPIAIINGAHGGKPVEFFQRNDANPLDQNTNYGRLLKRVQAGELTGQIRAIVWHQGESNAYGQSSDFYVGKWKELYDDWMEDYPNVEMTYIFQIRNGCKVTEDNIASIKEAHRQLAEELDNVDIMSTSGEDHHTDNCHFTYESGYKLFGEHIYSLMDRDLYNAPYAANIEAPQIAWAEKTGNSEITLIMKNRHDRYTWETDAENDFQLAGTSVTVSSGKVENYKVILTLSGSISTANTITYLGHQQTAAPLVRNANDIGTVHFKNFPITMPFTRDSTYVQAILDSNGRTETVASISQTNGTGRIDMLNLKERSLSVLPPEVGLLDDLTALTLEGNDLSTLPLSITHLTPASLLNVNGNYFCGLPDSINNWLDTYSTDKDWQQTQLCYNPVKHNKEMYQSGIQVLSSRNHMTFILPNSGIYTSARLVNARGKLIHPFDNIKGTTTLEWNANGVVKGVYYLQLFGQEENTSVLFLLM
ncbi:MAG: hypothetical protein HQK83_09430 [Fibrobacteria bacterium]|nr:hypothetical protein [Fibrobacteria bacterium]